MKLFKKIKQTDLKEAQKLQKKLLKEREKLVIKIREIDNFTQTGGIYRAVKS